MPKKKGPGLVEQRRKKRIEIMGKSGVDKQDKRNARAEVKGALTPGDSVAKARGRQAVKRVGEYKAAAKQNARIKRMNTPLARAVKKEREEQFKKRQEAKQHKTSF